MSAALSLAVEPSRATVPWTRVLLPALALLQLVVLTVEQIERAGRLHPVAFLFVVLRVALTLAVLPAVLGTARAARRRLGGPARGVVVAAAVLSGLSVAGALVAESLFFAALHFTVWPHPDGFLAGYRAIPLSSLGLPMTVLLGVAALDHAWAVAGEAHARQTRAARLRSQSHQARLELLRSQLHPHFLFNSLNSAIVLARRDPARAAELLERLERVFASSLEHEGEPFTALGDELAWMRDYLAVEEFRFPDRLAVELGVQPGAERAELPRLLLQPLVENALRHGVGRVPGSGFLRLRAHRQGAHLVVGIENNGRFRCSREGFGLTLTRRRLREAYGGAAWLTVSSAADVTLVTVTLPWTERGPRAAPASHADPESRP